MVLFSPSTRPLSPSAICPVHMITAAFLYPRIPSALTLCPFSLAAFLSSSLTLPSHMKSRRTSAYLLRPSSFSLPPTVASPSSFFPHSSSLDSFPFVFSPDVLQPSHLKSWGDKSYSLADSQLFSAGTRQGERRPVEREFWKGLDLRLFAFLPCRCLKTFVRTLTSMYLCSLCFLLPFLLRG